MVRRQISPTDPRAASQAGSGNGPGPAPLPDGRDMATHGGLTDVGTVRCRDSPEARSGGACRLLSTAAGGLRLVGE
jgi:hypothetical protein